MSNEKGQSKIKYQERYTLCTGLTIELRTQGRSVGSKMF